MSSFDSIPSDEKISPAEREELMDQVKQSIAVANAQELLQKMTEKCFQRCIGKPGSSVDNSEQYQDFGPAVISTADLSQRATENSQTHWDSRDSWPSSGKLCFWFGCCIDQTDDGYQADGYRALTSGMSSQALACPWALCHRELKKEDELAPKGVYCFAIVGLRVTDTGARADAPTDGSFLKAFWVCIVAA
ncbi:mitochondrial import inner membrane translocase subunit Tim13-like [Tropilaelaps mercedesae]|uniref:Mitochondrial import inner membrane translocase subunit Tim13-like n=1 Tax=Tropilaelaps mercedesae TaxID=418985 RepID=A0A1V9XR92_9ACAR|nr:mitochondrial import inner membrane translocase subunit Tim13-like [Tropilaelaps mercedesae]